MAPRAGRAPGGVPKFWTRPAAALAVEEIEAITEAALSFTGSDIATPGDAELIAVDSAALAFAPQTIGVLDTEQITAASLSFAGQTVGITDTEAITAAALTLAGQAVAEAEAVGITAAALAFSVSTIATPGDAEVIAVDGTALTFAGQDIGIIDPAEPPVAAAGGGRGWWRRRRRRERENIELILRDLLLPEAVTDLPPPPLAQAGIGGPVLAPRIRLRTARVYPGRLIRGRLLATTSLQLDLPGSQFGAGLPRISAPSIRPASDEDEEEIALLLAILFDDGVPYVRSPPILPSLDEEEEEIAVLLATLEPG